MNKEYWEKKINEETSMFLGNLFELVQDDFHKMYQKSVLELKEKQENLNKQIGELLGQKDIISQEVDNISLKLKDRENKQTKLQNSIVELTEKEGKLIAKNKEVVEHINSTKEKIEWVEKKEIELKKKEEELNIKTTILNDKENSLKRIYNG